MPNTILYTAGIPRYTSMLTRKLAIYLSIPLPFDISHAIGTVEELLEFCNGGLELKP